MRPKLWPYDERVPERIWDLVDVDWGTLCWNWLGTTQVTSGFTTCRMWYRPSKDVKGSYITPARYFYGVAHNVDMADVPQIIRKCSNALCVNPAHNGLRDNAEDFLEEPDSKGGLNIPSYCRISKTPIKYG